MEIKPGLTKVDHYREGVDAGWGYWWGGKDLWNPYPAGTPAAIKWDEGWLDGIHDAEVDFNGEWDWLDGIHNGEWDYGE
jgi:hypothetical protein